MNLNPSILWPVFALAGWTYGILLLVAFRRVRAGRQGRLRPSAFVLGESADVPSEAVLANRNYMNLLELPVLFYVACLLACVTAQVTPLLCAVAWMYVGLRILHSLIHVTYNRVMHRFAAFAASNAVLLLLWMGLAWNMTQAAL